MAHQIKNELSLKQEEKAKNASATRILGIIRNTFTLQASKVPTAIPLQIAGENPRKLREKPDLEATKAVAEMLLRRVQALQ
jgi:hypothetical protein